MCLVTATQRIAWFHPSLTALSVLPHACVVCGKRSGKFTTFGLPRGRTPPGGRLCSSWQALSAHCFGCGAAPCSGGESRARQNRGGGKLCRTKRQEPSSSCLPPSVGVRPHTAFSRRCIAHTALSPVQVSRRRNEVVHAHAAARPGCQKLHR